MANAVAYSTLSDAQLLDFFVARRDEAAFSTLVRRHGPMVLGVCRRILGNSDEAEDAFQTTFLVLVRKADSIERRSLLNNWLYGVAYRTAAKARARRLRWQSLHRRPTEEPWHEPTPEIAWDDVRSVLDQEVDRLPDRLRVVVVLCYLEGKSQEQAAQMLGCPRGSVAGWLSRARDLLRARLTRRGIALASVLVLLRAEALEAGSLPDSLVDCTTRAATEKGLPAPQRSGSVAVAVAIFLFALLVSYFTSDEGESPAHPESIRPASRLEADDSPRQPKKRYSPRRAPENHRHFLMSTKLVFLAPPSDSRSTHVEDSLSSLAGSRDRRREPGEGTPIRQDG